MNLADNGEKNIFEKMSVDYDTFRLLEEKEKINSVRKYYMHANRTKGKYEMGIIYFPFRELGTVEKFMGE